jgi:transposase
MDFVHDRLSCGKKFRMLTIVDHFSRESVAMKLIIHLRRLPEIKKLRKTLMKWRVEIINHFENRLTNARTEGFNNVAKLYQKRAWIYIN